MHSGLNESSGIGCLGVRLRVGENLSEEVFKGFH